MSRLSEYRELEIELEHQLAKLEKFKTDPGFTADLEFEAKLKALLLEYDKGLRDVISILDPGRTGRSVGGTPERRAHKPRRIKIYRNPLTGEIVETKGGNNKLLSAWKAQFGHEEVESWIRD